MIASADATSLGFAATVAVDVAFGIDCAVRRSTDSQHDTTSRVPMPGFILRSGVPGGAVRTACAFQPTGTTYIIRLHGAPHPRLAPRRRPPRRRPGRCPGGGARDQAKEPHRQPPAGGDSA